MADATRVLLQAGTRLNQHLLQELAG
jgi:hypothetical protein